MSKMKRTILMLRSFIFTMKAAKNTINFETSVDLNVIEFRHEIATHFEICIVYAWIHDCLNLRQ